MKKIINVLLATLILTGVSTVSAHAGDGTIYWNNGIASTTPPTPQEAAVAGFAVVNTDGVVKGVIACNISSCPSVLEGTYMDCTNCKLVQQTPASPDGNAVGYVGTPENPVRYDAQAQVFTQGSASTPAPITRSETVDTATLTATIYSDVVTFGPNNVVDGQMQFTPVVTSNTSATISATEGLTKEMAMFETPKTRAQLQANIQGKLLLMERYLNRFYTLLNGWILD